MPAITSAIYIDNADINNLTTTLNSLTASGARAALVFGSDQDAWGEQHSNWLQTLSVPVCGGVFPHVLYKGHAYQKGTVVVGLDSPMSLYVLNDISERQDWQDEFEALVPNSMTGATVVTFVDGLAKNIERLIEELYAQIGSAAATSIGCGAGSLNLMQKPCVITPAGLLCDAAIVAVMPYPCHLGVDHGWEVCAGPFLVTEAEANCIHTLNYQAAGKVYQNTIESLGDFRFNEHSFFEIAKTHPFGISSVDGELLVRDPIAQQGQSLICVGEVPQNATVYLLQGKPESLIASAGAAANKAVMDVQPGADFSAAIIFDCISRSLFLDQHFERELQLMESNFPVDCTSFGALTLGEICTSPTGPITLLNKSTVIAVL